MKNVKLASAFLVTVVNPDAGVEVPNEVKVAEVVFWQKLGVIMQAETVRGVISAMK